MRSIRTRLRGTRGATAVEYALGLALFVTVILGSLQYLQSRSGAELATRSDGISDPGNVGGVPTTFGSSSTLATTTTTSTTTTTPTSTTAPSTTMAAPQFNETQAATDVNGGKWKTYITITVTSTSGPAVSGVAVNYTWSSGNPANGNCVTDASGQCHIDQVIDDSVKTIQVTVTSMVKSGWTAPALPITSPAFGCNGHCPP